MSRNQSHMQSQALSHRTRRLDERVEKLILTWLSNFEASNAATQVTSMDELRDARVFVALIRLISADRTQLQHDENDDDDDEEARYVFVERSFDAYFLPGDSVERLDFAVARAGDRFALGLIAFVVLINGFALELEPFQSACARTTDAVVSPPSQHNWQQYNYDTLADYMNRLEAARLNNPPRRFDIFADFVAGTNDATNRTNSFIPFQPQQSQQQQPQQDDHIANERARLSRRRSLANSRRNYLATTSGGASSRSSSSSCSYSASNSSNGSRDHSPGEMTICSSLSSSRLVSDTAEPDAASAAETLAKYERRIETLTLNLNNAETDLRALHEANERLRLANSELMRGNEALRRDREELRDRLERADHELAKRAGLVEQLEREANEWRRERTKLQAEVAALRLAIETSWTRETRPMSHMLDTEHNISQLSTETSELASQLSSICAENADHSRVEHDETGAHADSGQASSIAVTESEQLACLRGEEAKVMSDTSASRAETDAQIEQLKAELDEVRLVKVSVHQQICCMLLFVMFIVLPLFVAFVFNMMEPMVI